MKQFCLLVSLFLLAGVSPAQAQNDNMYFWKEGKLAHKSVSVKPAELDSITIKPQVTVEDIDGNIYKVDLICNQQQLWTISNLKVSHYRNGEVIPQVTDPTVWEALTTGAWCYYDNDPANEAVYGKLYNWYAVNDPRGLAPAGYHIPSSGEWLSLTSCLVNNNFTAAKMKDTSFPFGSNSSGFTGLPGGSRYRGLFGGIGANGTWWTSSQSMSFAALTLGLLYNSDSVFLTDGDMVGGFSVRCLRD